MGRIDNNEETLQAAQNYINCQGYEEQRKMRKALRPLGVVTEIHPDAREYIMMELLADISLSLAIIAEKMGGGADD